MDFTTISSKLSKVNWWVLGLVLAADGACDHFSIHIRLLEFHDESLFNVDISISRYRLVEGSLT